MSKHDLSGKFVVIEGREAVGKSTQIRAIEQELRTRFPGRDIVFVREPGGTPFGEEARALFIKGMAEASPRALFSVLMASRFELVAKVIEPALKRGALVVADRYYGSMYAYQIVAQRSEELRPLFYNHQQLVPRPDLTLVIDLPTDVVLARISARKGEATAFDLAAREFHDGIALGFHEYAKYWSGHPVIFVDGNRSPEEVTASLLEHLLQTIS